MDVFLCASVPDHVFPVFAISSLMFNHNSPFVDIVWAKDDPLLASAVARTVPVTPTLEIMHSPPCLWLVPSSTNKGFLGRMMVLRAGTNGKYAFAASTLQSKGQHAKISHNAGDIGLMEN